LVKTKSVYHDPIDQDDGVRILVMRWWPRGVSKEKKKIGMWIRELGPSKELLQDLMSKKIDIPEYEKRYFKEMESRMDRIKELAELAGEGLQKYLQILLCLFYKGIHLFFHISIDSKFATGISL